MSDSWIHDTADAPVWFLLPAMLPAGFVYSLASGWKGVETITPIVFLFLIWQLAWLVTGFVAMRIHDNKEFEVPCIEIAIDIVHEKSQYEIGTYSLIFDFACVQIDEVLVIN